MQQIQQSIISLLSQTVSYRDSYTVQHSGRVASIATYIGKNLGMNNNDIIGLRFGSLVHDIGKVAVPLEILNKVAPLTDIEHNIIKQHPIIGHEILSKMQWDWPVPIVAIQHHERLNGTIGGGYPYGITNDNIIPESKIIAVADIVDSMCFHRPYRPALVKQDTINFLIQEQGISLDHDYVTIALQWINENV